jgi:hypothetical protein
VFCEVAHTGDLVGSRPTPPFVVFTGLLADQRIVVTEHGHHRPGTERDNSSVSGCVLEGPIENGNPLRGHLHWYLFDDGRSSTGAVRAHRRESVDAVRTPSRPVRMPARLFQRAFADP